MPMRLSTCIRWTRVAARTTRCQHAQLHTQVSQKGSISSDLFSKRQVLTLERSIGASLGRDAELWKSGAFDVSLYPDLPAAMTWRELLRLPFRRSAMTDTEHLQRESAAAPSLGWVVRTVGVQLRQQSGVRRRLLLRAGLREDGSPAAGIAPADGLLLVSGSHPLRGALGWMGLLQDSTSALHAAAALKQQGLLPQRTALWAVANPLLDAPASLERKVAAGAEAVLTQPPLLWPVFESWFEGIERLNLQKEVKLVIGIPMLTSARSVRFWLQLCGTCSQAGAAQLLQSFQAQEAERPGTMRQFCRDYTAELIGRVQQLPDIAGLHVMPVSGEGRRLAADLVQHGCL